MIVTNEGLKWMLEQLVAVWQGAPANEDIFLVLFKDGVIDHGTVWADMTEADFAGYAAIHLNDWQAPLTIPGDMGWAVERARQFQETADGRQDFAAWGVRTAGNVLLWGDNYEDGEEFVEFAGDVVDLFPSIVDANFA